MLLSIPVVKPAFGTLLIAAVGGPMLPAPGFGPARRAAIALSAIAMCTNPEHRLASLAAANALPENHFSMNRHPPTQADFDNGNGSCQGRTSLDGDLLMKVAEPEPRCCEQRGSLPPSKPQYKFSRECSAVLGKGKLVLDCGVPGGRGCLTHRQHARSDTLINSGHGRAFLRRM
jgi:hypothetical protein